MGFCSKRRVVSFRFLIGGKTKLNFLSTMLLERKSLRSNGTYIHALDYLYPSRLFYILILYDYSVGIHQVNGTRLAAGFEDGTVIAWSYPSGNVIFRMKKHSDYVKLIVWNPFRQDVLATRSYQVRTLTEIRPLTCEAVTRPSPPPDLTDKMKLLLFPSPPSKLSFSFK